MVQLARFYDPADAVCAYSMLEAYGIDIYLQDYFTSYCDWTWVPAIGGFRLCVLEHDLPLAIDLLADFDKVERAAETAPEALRRPPGIVLKLAPAALIWLFIGPFLPFWARKRRWHEPDAQAQTVLADQ